MNDLKDIARTLLAKYYVVHDALMCACARAPTTGSLIRQSSPGRAPVPGSKLAAIYVHYDPNGIVHDYVQHQLQELAGAGFRTIFVTNSPVFPSDSQERAAAFCATVLWRSNIGYDFGAYRDGIAALGDTGSLAGLALMNDSVYGPIRKLDGIIEQASASGCDFWGIADSWEQNYHVQSFFLLFFPGALKSLAFQNFWRSFPYISNKFWVIRNGEVGLTQSLLRAGLRCGVLAPFWSVAEAAKLRLPALREMALKSGTNADFDRFQAKLLGNRKVNPMQYYWDTMILDFQCPFIKRELVKINPARIPGLSQWSNLITAHSDYDVGMIARHLHSTAPSADAPAR